MPNSCEHTDRELVEKLRDSDSVAFRLIFDRYRVKLLFYTAAMIKSDGAARDIVQETFIRLWTNRRDLDPEKSLSGYLHTIARNLALNYLKRAGYDKELKKQIWSYIEEHQLRVETEENLFRKESHRLIQEAVELLPPGRRRIFRLSREEGMSHKEIADHLDISKNTVKNQMVSALKEIRAYLQRHTDIALFWIFVFGYSLLI